MTNLSKKVHDILENKANKLFVPNGHFYSPNPNLFDIAYYSNYIKKTEIHFDLNVNNQRKLLNEYKKFYEDFNFAKTKAELNQMQGNSRYYFENEMFSYGDAIGLYSFIRYFKPKNIFEIGSGFSSALSLDTIDAFCRNEINFSCLEPYPDLLLCLLNETDNIEINRKALQQVDPKIITDRLGAGDLLFVDSTHVLKVGSDVMFLFDKILPYLKKGVYVHFHDIFYPFTYPENWLKSGRCWNEAFFLKQFLTGNSDWEITYWGDMLFQNYRQELLDAFPIYKKNGGASIYIKKVKD